MIRHVIWDWNGTLLDDVDGCVATLNDLRAERGMAPVRREDYRARFGFPVKAYYESIGFDFSVEDFAALSRAFIARFRQRASMMRLYAGAPALLAGLRARGVSQIVISAMETRLLGQMLREYGVSDHVQGHHGRDDLSAASKVELGAAVVRALGWDPARTVVIGDTLHDRELAEAIGCRVVLHAGGHQSRDRLASAGAMVVESLHEVDDVLARPRWV